MNERDLALAAQLDIQAGWFGQETPEQPRIDVALRDGDHVRLSDHSFEVLHTPGHTQGSICLLASSENKLIAGDTLFRDSIGRTDLPGGAGRQILASIRDKLLPLADGLIVVPG